MNTIISNINAQIKVAAMLNNIALYGIADPIVIHDEQDSFYPVVIDTDGECRDVLFDDTKDVVIYHRLERKSYNTVYTSGYGDDPKRSVVYDMSMVVCGKRAAKNIYDMETICGRAIRSVSDAKHRATTEVVAVDFNSPRVFASEYTGVQFPIQPNIYLFKINYKITRIQSPCHN